MATVVSWSNDFAAVGVTTGKEFCRREEVAVFGVRFGLVVREVLVVLFDMLNEAGSGALEELIWWPRVGFGA